MSDATLIAVIAVIPVTITAIGALIVSISNSRKVTEVSAKADVIHSLTNDSLSKATNALAVANETIKGLEKVITAMTMKETNANPRMPPGSDARKP